MTPTDIRKAIAALTKADYHFVGLRPADAAPTAPCILLPAHDVGGLSYAADAAGRHWPDCTDWALIAADDELIMQDPAWPVEMRALRSPVQIAAFSS
jgi:hypothetical protein